MKGNNKIASASAFTGAFLYIIGIVYFVFILKYSDALVYSEKLILILENIVSVSIIYFLIYTFFGIVLITFSLKIYTSLRCENDFTAKFILSLGLIWSGLLIASGMIFNFGVYSISEIYPHNPNQAVIIFSTISIISEGIGGGNEIVGVLFRLLISLVIYKYNVFTKSIANIGLIAAFAGIASSIQVFSEITNGIFGFSQIIWFLMFGIHFLKESKFYQL